MNSPFLSVERPIIGPPTAGVSRDARSVLLDDTLFTLPTAQQVECLQAMEPAERRLWLRALPPDDVVDMLQALEDDETRATWIALVGPTARREITALLAWAEDEAGGLMSPRFARLRPEMRVGEALGYLRRQALGQLETLYYAYVLDREQRLVGVVSFRDLFSVADDTPVVDVMHRDLVTVAPGDDQEGVARAIAKHDLLAVPVVDEAGVMKGIVTVDDIVDVVVEEASEDIHKLGGLEALDEPYLQTSLLTMVRKRAGWLSTLFIGELLTATAMAHYEDAIAKAVVLAVFVPLIISSGGNTGSQAATLVIRAMAVGDLGFRDIFKVMRRELISGLLLGSMLGFLGVLRVLGGQAVFHSFGGYTAQVALTVFIALVGVVLWGTLAGSLLPFLIRKAGFDPASASAPFVATLVDVTGLVIYFSVAQVLLGGTLL